MIDPVKGGFDIQRILWRSVVRPARRLLFAFPKYILSFFKSSWKLKDYPIRLRHFTKISYNPENRNQPVAWSAQIVDWSAVVGVGQTREEALSNLDKSFARYEATGKPLPRPGTRVPLVFAPTTLIQQYEPIAIDFFEKILGLNYRDCFISDESSLWDFHNRKTNSDYHRKIALRYGVDVSDIESGNLVEIFKRIDERHKAQRA